MDKILALAIALFAALVGWAIGRFVSHSRRASREIQRLRNASVEREGALKAEFAVREGELRAGLASREAELKALRETAAQAREDYQNNISALRIEMKAESEKRVAELKAEHERSIAELKAEHARNIEALKAEHERTLGAQIEAIRTQMQAENARIQKEREESLKKEASETFRTIAGSLGEDIKKMAESFDAHKKETAESASSIKTKFEETARSLILQTDAVSKGAEQLASALRGQNKMQGCWGETILENIFVQEGLEEGRDFDREVTLRDASGNIVHNVDSGSRMRPDFILHYPDETDVIVDSKVSLSALSDYYAAQSDEARDEAARRNLKSVLDHIKELTTKEYQRHAKSGRKTLDYVVMFIPNYGALQLAKSLQPNIFAEAFKQNVLLTTEETIMPFLRIIRTAWTNQEQINNLNAIVGQAQLMVERVADFCSANETVGKKLREALETHEKASKKLEAGGQSILHSAHEVIGLGVPTRKALPPEKE